MNSRLCAVRVGGFGSNFCFVRASAFKGPRCNVKRGECLGRFRFGRAVFVNSLKLVFPVFAVLMITSECSAAILFDGKSVGYEFLYPDTATVVRSDTLVVGALIERNNLTGANPALASDVASINLSDTSVSIDFYNSNVFLPESFNGIRLFDLGGLNALATMTGYSVVTQSGFSVGSPSVTVLADSISINFQGVTADDGASLSFNVSSLAPPAAVPEPASAAFLGLGSLALVVRRLRRRSSVVA
jgi:hypothetical protein